MALTLKRWEKNLGGVALHLGIKIDEHISHLIANVKLFFCQVYVMRPLLKLCTPYVVLYTTKH